MATRSLEGSVYKTPDGKRWYARLRYTDTNGKSREKKRTCRTHAIAKAKIAELKAEIENVTGERCTYRDLDAYYRKRYVHEARFVGNKKVSGFRQSIATVNHYLDAALEHFGDKYADAITHEDLEDYKFKIENTPTRHGRPRSVSDTHHHLKRLRRVFKVGVQTKRIAANPFDHGDALIIETFETERTRILSHDEENQLLAACDNRWKQHLIPLIIFAVETGCRRGEIKTLRWSHVNFKTRTITIEQRNTKTLKPRLVPITARLQTTLAKLRRNTLRPNSLVFGRADFKTAFNSACHDAKLYDVTFHDLRHTATTRMNKKLRNATLVMKITGHTQERTFRRYINLDETEMLDIAATLDAAA